MDSYHVFWLLDELNVLVRNGVISEEVAKRIAGYYAPQVAGPAADGPVPAAPADAGSAPVVRPPAGKRRIPRMSVALIPVLLSVTAAVLIAAGIISLIAYNWSAIPRTAKAVFAFVLLLAVQAAGSFVFLRGDSLSKGRWREGAAVLWSLLFGGVVAFISQICRLPGNTASFLLVWSLSSILLTYAMQSVGTFVISLLLSASYAVACRSLGGTASLFYLLFAALCPFALRFKYGSRIMFIVAAAMLGVVLDKSIPGLWIVCSVSLAVLGLEYALSRNYRGLASLSGAGLCVLLLILSDSWAWRGIGWQFVRQPSSAVGLVTDAVLALGLTGAALAWPFIPFLRGKRPPRWQLSYPLCALAVLALFIIYAAMPSRVQQGLYLAPTVIVFLFSVLFLAHVLHSKRSYSLFLLFFLCCSAAMAGMNLPVFAVALLLLLLEAVGVYPSAAIRGAAFAALMTAVCCMTLEPVPGWHGASLVQYALFRPEALPWQLALYAMYLLVSVCLFVRRGNVAPSLDLIAVCGAVMLVSVLDMALGLGRQQLCMVYFCLVLLASLYRLFGRRDEAGGGIVSYILPFAALTVYFFWTAAFVMKLNWPVPTVTAFLLLFEAVGRYHASRSGRDCRSMYVLSRVLAAVWMPCVALLQEGTAFAVYEQGALPFQMTSCACVVLAALVLLFLSRRWKDSLDLLVLLPLLLLVAALLSRGGQDVDERGLHTFLYVFTAAGVYGYTRFRLQNRPAYLPYVVVFVLVCVADLYHLTGTWFLCPPAMPLLAALYFVVRERGKAFPWAVLCAAAVFASAFAGGSFSHARRLDLPQLIPVCIALLAYGAMSLYPAVCMIRKGRSFNYVFAIHSLVVTCVLLVILAAGISGNSPLAGVLDKGMSYFSFACVFLAAGYAIWESYTDASIARANTAACYAALALVIKFFSDDYGFVAKGILFIALGVAMLVLNLLLHRGERTGKPSGEVPNEAAE
jgi:uncharacterized membrane protein